MSTTPVGHAADVDGSSDHRAPGHPGAALESVGVTTACSDAERLAPFWRWFDTDPALQASCERVRVAQATLGPEIAARHAATFNEASTR